MMSIMSHIPQHIAANIIITKSGCMLWRLGNRTKYASCRFSPKANLKLLHVFMYELFIKKIDTGMQLDHLCRIKKCVNPTHLEEVTNRENVRRGNSTKLTADLVRQIHKLHLTSKFTHDRLASKFGVSIATIADILHRRSWTDIGEEFPIIHFSTKTSSSTIDKIIELRNKGKTFRQIALFLKIGESTVSRLYNERVQK